MKSIPFLGFLALSILVEIAAHELEDEKIGRWIFSPRYTLPGNAENFPGPWIAYSDPEAPFLSKSISPGAELFGLKPTDRKTRLVMDEHLPSKEFTLQAWILDHSNQKIGMAAGVFANDPKQGFVLSYFNKHVYGFLNTDEDSYSPVMSSKVTRNMTWKERWSHIALRYDGSTATLFVNAKQVASQNIKGLVKYGNQPSFEIAAYLDNEPYMDFENLVRAVQLHSRALSDEEIETEFNRLTDLVETTRLAEHPLHFTAGPYLHYATQNGINVSWETSEPSSAVLRYGTTIPLDKSIEFLTNDRVHIAELKNLEAETNYYYEIEVQRDGLEKIRSGILTFKTAVHAESAFRFTVIGDTESRPYVNDRIAKLMWTERPHFAINLGDITDSGQRDKKFEWNFEYFAGVTQLFSRIPVFTVPGNGESDLHWYRYFHNYPDPENYYTFQYGNAQFFMLDSNEKIEPTSQQYKWLEEQLQISKATWKIVCHHHCTYSSDENDYNDTWKGEASYFIHKNVKEAIPLYEEYGIDIVFFGHVHAYERSHPLRSDKISQDNGVIYIESGGGGGNLEDFAPHPSFFSRKTYRGHHYCVVNIAGPTLELQMITSEGSTRDSMTLKKP